MKNELTVKIFNKEYRLISDESQEYTDKLAKELNHRMSQLMNSKTMMSHQDAAALIALETYDELVKARESIENIRSQIKDYADDAVKQKARADEAASQTEALRERIAQLEKEVKLRTKLSSDKDKTSANDIISQDIQKALGGSNVPFNAMSNRNRNL